MKYLKLFEKYLSSNFWVWFGKSKMVDDKGNPLIMYHGSPHISKIDSFKNNKGYHFFTSDEDEATRYTGVAYDVDNKRYQKSLREKIKTFYIKAENPFDVTNMNESERDKLLKLLDENKNVLLKFVKNESDIIDNIILDFDYDNELDLEGDETRILEYILTKNADNYVLLEHPILQDWIIRNGYDSFYTIESGIGINIAVYDSNQIKSATNNNGNFSSSKNINEDIN